ncbi:uncharacterized protein B0I36DRAFT_89095 [Microdochium trichocladiopsis]|uniref:Uncharacterized protein n=1 Tax=Microdochium trichocladiopsis TaxID=1682393 RepID=A0A9P9BT67_9PEZI|nr:uncharacterized protein B0I36DRAFT_89095 [Microdochium trichocladiopsis]KAH7035177.1 hypothetical protein B0I36DRAFT_89095 [Microdochium trichocladiopsis]
MRGLERGPHDVSSNYTLNMAKRVSNDSHIIYTLTHTIMVLWYTCAQLHADMPALPPLSMLLHPRTWLWLARLSVSSSCRLAGLGARMWGFLLDNTAIRPSVWASACCCCCLHGLCVSLHHAYRGGTACGVRVSVCKVSIFAAVEFPLLQTITNPGRIIHCAPLVRFEQHAGHQCRPWRRLCQRSPIPDRMPKRASPSGFWDRVAHQPRGTPGCRQGPSVTRRYLSVRTLLPWAPIITGRQHRRVWGVSHG